MLYLRVCAPEVTLLYASRGTGERKGNEGLPFLGSLEKCEEVAEGKCPFHVSSLSPYLPSPSLHSCVSICLKRICLPKMGLELPPVLGLGPGGPGVELHCWPIIIFIRNGRLHKEPC